MNHLYAKQSSILEAKIGLYRLLRTEEASATRHQEKMSAADKVLLDVLEHDPNMSGAVHRADKSDQEATP